MNVWLHVVTHPAFLLACVLVGFAGRNRRTGFFGYLVMSLPLTPLLMLFVLYVGAEKPSPDPEDEPARPEDAKKAKKARKRSRG